MFKSCCARPNKKINKSRSKTEKMDSRAESDHVIKNPVLSESKTDVTKIATAAEKPEIKTGESDCVLSNKITKIVTETVKPEIKNEDSASVLSNNGKVEDIRNNMNTPKVLNENGNETDDESSLIKEKPPKVTLKEDTFKEVSFKNDIMKKRYSVDYKKSRLDFKRYSVDFRRDSDTLIELEQLEKELSRTNIDVRVEGRRKSTGILKSTNSGSDVYEQPPEPSEQQYFNREYSDDDEVFEESSARVRRDSGPREPPATPVGRDELALRRHRFFSDLICAARAAVEHRVRFDPLGPTVADAAGIEPEASPAPACPASDLEALIERLERVTSRLERLPQLRTRTPTPPRSPAPSPASFSDPAPPPPQPPFVEEYEPTDNMSVNGYQDIVQGPLRTYLELSKQIGGDVAAHAALVNSAFQAQLSYIQLATSRGKPAQAEEISLLKPTSDQISAIQQFREKNRTSNFFNHLSAISESIPALGWVAVSPTPAPYVKEMNDAGQFYSNRVLKEWKEKDKRHAEWCRAWVQLLSDLQAYVKQFHTTGLVWSGKGGAPPPPPGGMPPPPPVLPEADFSNLALDDRSALFAEINRGEGITGSLRKVTSEMQTHKNPQLRQGPAPFKAAAPAGRGPQKALPTPGAGALPDKPPVFMRDGKKWLIEYQKGNSNLLVENAEMNNVVYMFRCRDSALTVKGKVNGVILDSCTKCAVVFDNLVASVEFVNCQSVQMQVLGKVPTISIDKTDGCQIYLSPESLDVEIVSSKSSEMNVLVPKSNGDYTEYPVPEQFKTLLSKARTGLVTSPVENAG